MTFEQLAPWLAGATVLITVAVIGLKRFVAPVDRGLRLAGLA